MASYSNMKVKVGQTWARPGNSWAKLVIIRVDGKKAHYTLNNREYIANLLDDGTPFGWDDGWVIEEESPDSPPSTHSSRDSNQLLDFFKGVPAGYCPCNILKEQCPYHRP